MMGGGPSTAALQANLEAAQTAQPPAQPLPPGEQARPPLQVRRDCAICRKLFWMFNRRRHCLNCGRAVCSKHLTKKVLYHLNYNTPVDTCTECFERVMLSLSTAASTPRGATQGSWSRGNACHVCNRSFGLFKHRHHCRNCNQSVCSDHSRTRMILYHKGGNTAVRTCDRCQHGLNEAGRRSLEPDYVPPQPPQMSAPPVTQTQIAVVSPS
jgi:hypothetical protein